jgi:hypothetical protein
MKKLKASKIKRATIFFLQCAILLFGFVILAVLIRFPLNEGRAANLALFHIYTDPFILFGYATSIPLFVALVMVFKLLGYIGQSKLFSSAAVGTLKRLRYCAILFSIFTFTAGIFIKLFHNIEDDPAGFISLCILTIFLFIIIGTTASVFEKNLQKAIDLKSENDLNIL